MSGVQYATGDRVKVRFNVCIVIAGKLTPLTVGAVHGFAVCKSEGAKLSHVEYLIDFDNDAGRTIIVAFPAADLELAK